MAPSVRMAKLLASWITTIVCFLHSLPATAQDIGCPKQVIRINVTSSGGVMYSPGYPEEYRDSERCSWLLTSLEKGKLLQLLPLDLHVGREADPDGHCAGDVLTAYDGNRTASTVLHSWCGQDTSVVHSTGETVLLSLTTNNQRRHRGFALKYSLLTLSDNACDGTHVKTIPLQGSAVVADFSSPIWTFHNNIPGTCSWRLVADDVTRSVVIDLEKFDNGLPCEDGNFSVYDGPETSSPEVVRWCSRSTKPFTSVYLSGSQGMVVIRTRPDVTSALALRFRFYTRPKEYAACSLTHMPTLELTGQEPALISFPFAVSASGESCPVRLLSGVSRQLWARVDVMRVRGQAATCDLSDTGRLPLDVLQANETDGTTQTPERVPSTCWKGDHPVYWAVADSVIVSPGEGVGPGRLVAKVTPAPPDSCHGRILHRLAPSDKALELRNPPQGSRDLEYSSNTWCRYVIGGERTTDHVLARLEGELCELEDTCGDYVRIYDGPTTDSPVLYDSSYDTYVTAYVISTGRYVTYEVVTDEKANRGFIQAAFNSVPSRDLCSEVVHVQAQRTPRNLSSVNYPSYYPVNYMCQYCIAAAETSDVVHVKVLDCDLTYPCADAVEVYDGSDSDTAIEFLGRFCGRDTPSFVSKQSGLCLLFRSDPTLHGRGWLVSYYSAPPLTAEGGSVASALPSLGSSTSSSSSSSSLGTEVIVLAVLLAIVSLALIVLVLFLVVSRRRQGRQP